MKRDVIVKSVKVVDTRDYLFDCTERTYTGYPSEGESYFHFLNRSAWSKVNSVRVTLESWFAGIPRNKRKAIRSLFRSDDRQHTAALLELVTHEILCTIGNEVEADPNIKGKTPDYAATYKGSAVIVECTVVQETDDDFKAAQSEIASKRDSCEASVSFRVETLGVDYQISRATAKKAWKYRNVTFPLLLVVGGHRWFSHEHAIIHALFGRNTLRDPESFFGTSMKPRNTHVSGILFKSFDVEGSVWDLCRSQIPWEFVHNPWATCPLQLGMFPFATEWIAGSGTINEIEPTSTLNDALGLPRPWPPQGK